MLRTSTKHTHQEALAPSTTHTEEHQKRPNGHTRQRNVDNAGRTPYHPKRGIGCCSQPQPHPCKPNALGQHMHHHGSRKHNQYYSTPPPIGDLSQQPSNTRGVAEPLGTSHMDYTHPQTSHHMPSPTHLTLHLHPHTSPQQPNTQHPSLTPQPPSLLAPPHCPHTYL
jgi:hypothetical protein